jgi:hypothetical protein
LRHQHGSNNKDFSKRLGDCHDNNPIPPGKNDKKIAQKQKGGFLDEKKYFKKKMLRPFPKGS